MHETVFSKSKMYTWDYVVLYHRTWSGVPLTTTAFLHPAIERSNLHIGTGITVRTVNFEGIKTVGISYIAFQCLTGKFNNNNTIKIYPLGGLSRLDHQVRCLASLWVACGSSPALE